MIVITLVHDVERSMFDTIYVYDCNYIRMIVFILIKKKEKEKTFNMIVIPT